MTDWLRRRARLLLGLASALLALLLLDRLFPPDLTRWRDRSVQVLAEDGSVLHVFLSADGKWRLAARPDQVDPAYLAMLLAAEDHRFRSHPGIDPLAVLRAAGQLASHGRIVSGGSTLTMQVARLLEPHRRSVIGKLHDAVRALQLETRFGKDEILAMYLTLAPYGGNIEGVRAAALSYFGHEPDRLTPGEAAILVALPQRPARLRPDRHRDTADRAAGTLLERLVADGRIPPGAGETRPPSVAARLPFPSAAPQLAQRLKSRAGPDGSVRTTLDPGLQQALEALGRREAQWMNDGGDLAILIVDNRDRSVRAWLGGVRSALDLARRRRSPGSALKPFIYGLAFDDLAVAPETLVEDRPMRFGAWAPEDFDRGFKGQVTVREALQQSLNLPAVALLERIGPGRLSATLTGAGATLVFPDPTEAPTLPLALGGVGISLADLTQLYVGLARGGRAGPLRLLAGAPAGGAEGVLMSEHAAHMVTAILRGSPPPDGRLAPALAVDGREIAYKTGTSYGFRDAWAVGSTPRWTVGVWTGRADGTPRPGAYGRNTAAPLLFEAFDLLPAETAPAATGEAKAAGPLPAGLRQFAAHAAALPGADPPRILYPPDGATIDLEGAAGERRGLTLQAEGGTPPYRWSVNGMPVPPGPLRALPQWQPDGPGFARVSVLDGAGRRASVRIRLE